MRASAPPSTAVTGMVACSEYSKVCLALGNRLVMYRISWRPVSSNFEIAFYVWCGACRESAARVSEEQVDCSLTQHLGQLGPTHWLLALLLGAPCADFADRALADGNLGHGASILARLRAAARCR